jgi:uncharacterized cupredoxin-like copper-binding protein
MLALGMLAVAGCGGGTTDGNSAATSAGSGKRVAISEVEYKLDPSTVRVPSAGTYTLHVTNDGKTDHALEVEGNGVEEETETIAPGKSADLTVELKEGDYEVYCPIDGHRKLGMEGKLVVGAGGGGMTTDETETKTDSGGGYYP